MTYLQGERSTSYRCTDSFVDSTLVECLFSITPLPGALGSFHVRCDTCTQIPNTRALQSSPFQLNFSTFEGYQ
jgi:hypothetical protein